MAEEILNSEALKIPPHDLEAEKAVLGAVLIDKSLIHKTVELIGTSSEIFYDNKNKKIYEAMLDLLKHNEPIDLLTLKATLDRGKVLDDVGGMDYLTSLVESVEVVAHLEEYAQIVREKHLLRSLIQAGGDIIKLALAPARAEEVLDKASQKIMKVLESGVSGRDFLHVGKVGQKILSEISSSRPTSHYKFGYKGLDEKTLGLHPGQFIIIAARPGIGKTTFGINICVNVARELLKLHKDGKPPAICIFSLEMAADEIVRRILSSESGIAMNRLNFEVLERSITEKDTDKIMKTVEKIDTFPIFIDDNASSSVLEMKAKAKRIQLERGLALVLIDYIQLIPGKAGIQYRQFEVAEISRNLKLMARDLGVPVIALSQLSREIEKRTGKARKPRLADLRDSGAIEQDADLVLFLHSDEVDENLINSSVEVSIGKQRQGVSNVSLKFTFRKNFLQFAEEAVEP